MRLLLFQFKQDHLNEVRGDIRDAFTSGIDGRMTIRLRLRSSEGYKRLSGGSGSSPVLEETVLDDEPIIMLVSMRKTFETRTYSNDTELALKGVHEPR